MDSATSRARSATSRASSATRRSFSACCTALLTGVLLSGALAMMAAYSGPTFACASPMLFDLRQHTAPLARAKCRGLFPKERHVNRRYVLEAHLSRRWRRIGGIVIAVGIRDH
ncbi:MAG TPA: hypothetical protein VI195_06210 [Steroidobacteraceae bacterium]